MQVKQEDAYIKRAFFYLDMLYTGQIKRSGDFEVLSRTIGISFVCFPLFPDHAKLHHMFRLIDPDDHLALDIHELHMLELEKFHGESVDLLLTPLDKWLHVLKYAPKYAKIEEEIPQALREEEGIEMTIEEYRKTTADRKLLESIRLREKSEYMHTTSMAQARRKGLAEGLAEEREKAEKELAKAEKRRLEEKHEIARRLVQDGMDREKVKSVTKLSDEEMEGI